MARAAVQLAAQQAQEDASHAGWDRVTALESGTRIIVTLRTAGPVSRRLLSATVGELRVTAPGGGTPPETIARADVLAVALPARSGSLWAALAAGGATFAFIGFPAAIGLAAEEQCQPNCGGVMAKMALLMVGLPIGAGYLGYRTIGRSPERVVYRAPTDS